MGLNTEKITARRLTSAEVAGLGVNDRIFVTANTELLSLDNCYALAFLTKPGDQFEGGSFIVKTIYGETLGVVPDGEDEAGVYLADEQGAEIEVLQQAGVLLNLALFVPGGDAESLNALYSAAREQFGEGIVQRWREEVTSVPDIKVDLYEEQIRGRKGADGPKQDRRALDIYPSRVQFFEPSDGWKFVVKPHQEIKDDTLTI